MIYIISYLIIGFIVASLFARYLPYEHGGVYRKGSAFLLVSLLWPIEILSFLFTYWINFIQKKKL